MDEKSELQAVNELMDSVNTLIEENKALKKEMDEIKTVVETKVN